MIDKKNIPDTPDWSPARRATIRQASIIGMLLVLLGAFGALWGMSDAIAMLVLNAGTTIIISALGLHIGAASMERVGAWWLGRPQLPPAPEPAAVQVVSSGRTEIGPITAQPAVIDKENIDKENPEKCPS